MTRKSFNWGVLAGLFANRAGLAYASQAAAAPREKPAVNDWHAELTKRIQALDGRGGGTLELGDGVFEIDKPLHIPRDVSLLMTPNAVIRARANFQGDAVIVKGGGQYSKAAGTSGGFAVGSSTAIANR